MLAECNITMKIRCHKSTLVTLVWILICQNALHVSSHQHYLDSAALGSISKVNFKGLEPLVLVDTLKAVLQKNPKAQLNRPINSIIYRAGKRKVKDGCLSSVETNDTEIETSITEVNKFFMELTKKRIDKQLPIIEFDVVFNYKLNSDIGVLMGLGFKSYCWHLGSQHFNVVLSGKGRLRGTINVQPKNIEVIHKSNSRFAYFKPEFKVKAEIKDWEIYNMDFSDCGLVCFFSRRIIRNRADEAGELVIKKIFPRKVKEYQDLLNIRIPTVQIKLDDIPESSDRHTIHIHLRKWKDISSVKHFTKLLTLY